MPPNLPPLAVQNAALSGILSPDLYAAPGTPLHKQASWNPSFGPTLSAWWSPAPITSASTIKANLMLRTYAHMCTHSTCTHACSHTHAHKCTLTHAQSHAHTHTRDLCTAGHPAHTCTTHTHTRMRTHTHAHAHTHAHTQPMHCRPFLPPSVRSPRAVASRSSASTAWRTAR